MDNDLIHEIQQEGARQYPNEACGVVVRVGKKQRVVACRNLAENPREFFLMDVGDYAAASDMGEIIAIWHTHVEQSPQPSPADRVGCENSGLPWFIVAVHRAESSFEFSELVTVEPEGFAMDYLGRPYAFGVLDCYSLVRDFYRREYGIEIANGPRVPDFWKNGNNYFGEGWAERGFVRLIDQEPKEGDLFLIQTDNSGNPNHIAIYLGNEVILHHCHGRLSCRDIYGGFWKKHTTFHLRHESKC